MNYISVNTDRVIILDMTKRTKTKQFKCFKCQKEWQEQHVFERITVTYNKFAFMKINEDEQIYEAICITCTNAEKNGSTT